MKTRKNIIRTVILGLILSLGFVYAGTEFSPQDTSYHRDYPVVFAFRQDIRNSVVNSRTAGKLLFDAYYRGIAPQIGNKTLRNALGFFWSFTTTWSSTMWPHEFGHYLRAKQAGGDFYVEKVVFPMAFGVVDLPPDATIEDELLFVTGGFEANFMISRDIQHDYYRYNGLYNDELFTAFFHRVMYPAYTCLFVRMDPADPANWLDSEGGIIAMGDVASMARLTWERTGGNVILPDSSVAPELVQFYNRSSLMGVLWNLADMNLYMQAAALFRGETNGRRPRHLIEKDHFKWSYGTLFNASVLGAELYLNQYMHIRDRFYSAYLKYGFPFRNYGIGAAVHDLVRSERFDLGLQVDLWHQEYYGNGLSAAAALDLKLMHHIDLMAHIGWKTRGYVLGMPVESGMTGFLGLRYTPQ
ncbi:MAG: hypothetical protein K0B52_03725 [FCB group bacterium]|nr:hypothetical protein [FCB group bacterium]